MNVSPVSQTLMRFTFLREMCIRDRLRTVTIQKHSNNNNQTNNYLENIEIRRTNEEDTCLLYTSRCV